MGYAHGREQLEPVPDLRCTKLCPLRDQCCDPVCRFAHRRKHLRKLDCIRVEQQQGADMSGGAVAQVDAQPPCVHEHMCVELCTTSSVGACWSDVTKDSDAEVRSESTGCDGSMSAWSSQDSTDNSLPVLM